MLKRWLGPWSERNRWEITDAPGETLIKIWRRQHFKHVLRKAQQLMFPITQEHRPHGSHTLVLRWQPCLNCKELGNAHGVDRKCLFGPTYLRTT